MMNGCKYLDMMIKRIVEHYDLKTEWESTYEWAHDESYKLVEALKSHTTSHKHDE